MSEPLQLLGMDRRAFFLVMIVAYVMYQTISFFTGVVVGFVCFTVMREMSRRDPHIISILRSAATHVHSWYDYDCSPSDEGMGPVVTPPLTCWPHRR